MKHSPDGPETFYVGELVDTPAGFAYVEHFSEQPGCYPGARLARVALVPSGELRAFPLEALTSPRGAG